MKALNEKQTESVVFLSADLFTDSKRTPWAGEKIAQLMKSEITCNDTTRLIGESWELSCDPLFPSRSSRTQEELQVLISRDPVGMLGQQYINMFGDKLKLIIKLINSRMPLSYQVHPNEDYSKLQADESAKTESWLVLHADPEAGIYIGFNRKISSEEVSLLIRRGKGELKEILQFVPVKAGDYFEIAPGTPHAIGEGVLLLEPQFVNKGFGGKTYRLWDWGRRYNDSGEIDESGDSRELHIDQGLDLIKPEQQWGKLFLENIKVKGTYRSHRCVSILEYPANPYYQMFLLEFQENETVIMTWKGGFVFLEATQGMFSLADRKLQVGQPVFLPARLGSASISGKGKLAIVVPSTVTCQFL